jgi:hypothetical protein
MCNVQLIHVITTFIFLCVVSSSVLQCRHWYYEVCGSAVSVEAWPWACRSRDLSSIPDGGKRFFLLSTKSGAALGLTQPLILSIEEVLSSGVKRPECEVNHSPPSSAALINEWVYTSTPLHAFMACTRTAVLACRMHGRCLAVFRCV